ncbi:MAG: fused MFS/spermidine synthase [Myxococcales bacterium]|nr:fused MFS/spermidine synthase [Myxococcales bacterium]
MPHAPALLRALTVGLGAWLLFWLQPLVGRLILPRFGGGPLAWAVTLVFFQIVLLGGYAYTHLLVLRQPPRRGRVIHLALAALALLALPLGTPVVEASSPPLAILASLTLGVAAPALVLGATAPLVQAWAAQVDDRSPYRLYAWSNVGSLGALVAYPFVLEPAFGVSGQTVAWSVAYGALVLLLAVTARQGWADLRAPDAAEAGPPPTGGQRALWLLLTATSSALLVACSDLLTEDFAATPFLWVLPLGLFLLSYILAFGNPRWTTRAVWFPLLAVALLGQWWALEEGFRSSILTQVAVHSSTLFVACMVLHGEVVRTRPAPTHLTGFYLMTALGGALGGATVSLLAPLALPLRVEWPLALMAAAFLALWTLRRARQQADLRGEPPWIWALPALLILGLGGAYAKSIADDQAYVQATARGFFGVLRVRDVPDSEPDGPARKLLHGHIMHGREFTDARQGIPNAYYGPRSGLGLYFRWGKEHPPRRIGVLGLGVGTISGFARCGDAVDYWEIDPLVEALARDWFTYLSRPCVTSTVIVADGRLGVAASPHRYDLLVLDAFSGDAVPTHLLTREAIGGYLAKLTEGGVIAVNVSNRHLDLRPVVRAHAKHFALSLSEVTSKADKAQGLATARWMLLTRRPDLLEFIEDLGELDRVRDPDDQLVWTDDRAPLLPLLRALR